MLCLQVDDARKVGSCVVEVEVEDVNDNLPRFTQDVYSISIMENLPASFSVIQVSAQDPDQVSSGVFVPPSLTFHLFICIYLVFFV